MSFGFFLSPIRDTPNIDSQKNARAGAHDSTYLTGSGFQVFVTSGAGIQNVSGLLPDLRSADPSEVQAKAIANMSPSVRARYETDISNGRTQGQALNALGAAAFVPASTLKRPERQSPESHPPPA